MSASNSRRRKRTTRKSVQDQEHVLHIDTDAIGSDYQARIVIERDEDELPDERWIWGVTDNQVAEYITSTAADDLVEMPAVPERIESLLWELGLEGIERE